MAVIEFKGYKVSKIDFEEGLAKTRSNGKIKISPEFNVDFGESNPDDDFTDVTLSFKMNKSNNPFSMYIAITGRFEYKTEEDIGNVGEEQLLNTNAVALLFPYLRSIITAVTAQANITPLVLPTMNIVEMLKESKSSNK